MAASKHPGTKTAARDQHAALTCAIELPHDYRAGDILAFHARDPLALGERVNARALQKGLTWEGCAACLTIAFHPRRAEAALAVDGSPSASAQDSLERMVRRMLGLTQRIEVFEQVYQAHPQLGALIARHRGLRVPLTATPFEALTWAITGQQISVRAAIALRRKLIEVAGLKHSGGLSCYPNARQVARLTEHDLREAGFSQAKARTLIALSHGVQENRLPLDEWLATLPVQQIGEQLLRVRGIGPWTINYALLRGYGWLDGSLHGDAAVRRSLQALLGAEKMTEEHAKRWLAAFSPWRALIAAHLWALGSSDA